MNLNVLLRGQSNAALLGNIHGNEIISRVQSLLGFDGVNDRVSLEFAYDTPGSATAFSGTSFLTQWLTPTASGWQVGELEQSLLNYISAIPAAQKAQPTAVVWLHSEFDSTFGDLAPATWESAVRFDAALVRAAFGQSAAALPYLFVSAIPFGIGTDVGHQAIRIGMEDLAADPGFDAGIAARVQDADMNFDDADGNPATPDYGGWHQGFFDAQTTAGRIVLSLAEEWAAYAKPGSPVALAGGNVDNLGPQVVQATVSAPDQLMLKVQFDAASSLAALDATAAQGVGWTIIGPDGTGIDGGAAVLATGVADTMYVSFNGLIPAGGKLYYGYGYGRLAAADGSGEGHAVYDDAGLPIWVDAHGLTIGTPNAVTNPPVSTGGSVLVGAAGGSFVATAGADTWVFDAASGGTVIAGFAQGADHLVFNGIAEGGLVTWNTQNAGVPGLGVAWNSGDGVVFLAGVTALQPGDVTYGAAAAVGAPPVTAGGGSTTVGAAGGSFTATAGADTWVFDAASGTTVISGFTPGVDSLAFSGVDPAGIITWNTQRAGVAGLGVAWNAGDGHAFLAGVSQLGADDLRFGTAPAAVAGGGTAIGAAGGSYTATATAENWVIQPGSGHAEIQGFDPATDTLTFIGIARGSLITWQTSATPGLGIAWNLDGGEVILRGVGAVPDSHILIA